MVYMDSSREVVEGKKKLDRVFTSFMLVTDGEMFM